MKKQYERLLQISDDHKQITLPDSRFYQRNGDYYPSITHVLSSYPKGKHFEDWLKKVGYASEYIVKKAAEEGTQTHELCEDWLNGEECTFLDKYHRPKYQPHVWKMFLAFVNFWDTYKPTLIETEVHLFSDEINRKCRNMKWSVNDFKEYAKMSSLLQGKIVQNLVMVCNFNPPPGFTRISDWHTGYRPIDFHEPPENKVSQYSLSESDNA